ncbi:hypothetical protein MMC31_007214 [Peltigera leucophlebia]|nr:hypothetical protein [Peltigera leucophlebia]
MEGTACTPSASALPNINGTPNESQRSSTSNFAFLIHSQDSLNRNLPPKVDNKKAVRQAQRRRRTSPEDHAILEEEYAKNAKPEKAARMAIVSRVALGEKEVQIWFQNRRQMTRRKTLPPLPVEVMSTFPSSQESNVSNLSFNSGLSIDDSSQQSVTSTQTSIHHSQTPPEHLQSDLKTDGLEEVVVNAANLIGPNKTGLERAATTLDSNESSQGAIRDIPDSGLASCGLSRATRSKKPIDTSPSIVYVTHGPGSAIDHLSGISAVTQDRAEVNAKEDQGHCVVSIGHPSLPRRTSSLIRLSTSVDGKAEVVSDKEPASLLTDLNLKPRPRGSLQRSQSAVEPNDLSLGSRRGSITGRSRDARTWEFYCDSDARNALTEHAQREQSGSAVGPIGLIRSRNNKAVGKNTSKRNANPSQREPTKRQKPHDPLAEKPKLARSMSSVARLQSVKNIQKQDMKGKDKVPAAVLYEDGSDSDKENWEPGTQTSRERRPRRLVNPQIRRRLLEESRNHPSLSSSLGTLMNRESVNPRHSRPNTSSSHKANTPKIEAEVAEVMCEQPAEMPEDLDCVQNLLSLSQAAWSRAESE